MKKEFANVIVDISHEKVDRPFGYRIPERLADSVTPGVRVKIPFGTGNALRTGYVIEVTDHSEFPRERMKEIDSVLPDVYKRQAETVRHDGDDFQPHFKRD